MYNLSSRGRKDYVGSEQIVNNGHVLGCVLVILALRSRDRRITSPRSWTQEKKAKRNVGELEEYRTNEGFPNFILKTDLQTKKTQKLSKYQIEEMQVKYLSIPQWNQ